MEKYSIKEAVEKIVHDGGGDEADAAIIIRLNSAVSQMFILGVEPGATSAEAVKLADTLDTALRTGFKKAIAQRDFLKATGRYKSDYAETNEPSIDDIEKKINEEMKASGITASELLDSILKNLFGGENTCG